MAKVTKTVKQARMDKKVLRIGNLVEYEATTHIITEIGEERCLSVWHRKPHGEIYSHTYEEIKPIKPTVKLLTDLGFSSRKNEPDEGTVITVIDLLRKTFNTAGLGNDLGELFIYSVATGVQRVFAMHDIQNLYFEATGDTLTIN